MSATRETTTSKNEPKAEEKFIEAAGSTIDDDEDQWRPLTGNNDRDLQPVKQDRMQKLAKFLWESNLIADRIIELPLAFMLGDGVRLTVPDQDAQEVIDKFWYDPINNMDLSLEEYARELALFGEQCYPVFVNKVDGHVRLGYLDPAEIDKVITDPDNKRQPIGVQTKKDSKGNYKKYRVIINADETVFGPRARRKRKTFKDGECFYFRIRGLASGARGRSDLLPQMDWLDAYDQFLFGELDRNQGLRAFMWDVEIKGARQDEIDKKAKDIKVPESGGVRVHNESETWTPQSPNMNAADTSETARLFRNHTLGGATIPEHWFGGGGDVNRSTAGEMDEPTFKILGSRQRRLKYMLEVIGTFQIRMWSEHTGKKIKEGDRNFWVTCELPEMVQRDTTKYASALQQVVAACVGAMNAKLMTLDVAIKLIVSTARRLGVDVEPQQMIDDIKGMLTKQKEDDADVDLDVGT
ncbi:MAG: hypothetical protein P1V33_03470 [Pseudohongiella nitratireducens]|nr:hypothetical protein [Pseudohongiella nitratireducens]MDF1622514.1 hypothetical protein [Pseudohongiella nitratireducens]